MFLLRAAAIRAVAGLLVASAFSEVVSGAEAVVSAGQMAAKRKNHTATMLPTGKVLVAGGDDSSPPAVGKCDLYNPATGVWGAASPLATPRFGHTATILSNGKVLVVGGAYFSNGYLSSCELYDSTSGTWIATAPLNTSRAYHTATLLRDGRVLVAGGYNFEARGLNSAEIYDPAAAAWKTVAPMSLNRIYISSILLFSGKVLVIGQYSSAAEIFDPVSETWISTGPTKIARGAGHTLTLLPSGRVLLIGGQILGNSSYDTTAAVEWYDPETEIWSLTTATKSKIQNHTACLTADGRVLVAGGKYFWNAGTTNQVQLFDPLSSEWTTLPGLATGRAYHTATALRDGSVLFAGGGSITGSNNLSQDLISAEMLHGGSWPAPSKPILVVPRQPAANLEAVILVGVPGQRIELEASSDLLRSSAWITEGDFVLPSSPYLMPVKPRLQDPIRFYRAKAL